MIQLCLRPKRRMAVFAAAIGILLMSIAGCTTAAGSQSPAAQPGAIVSVDQTESSHPREESRARPASVDGLLVIYVDELPREARDTLRLIDRGGPFPYSKDGSTFQNREGILPQRQRGYYSEYTVITPGEDDRGARRIVAGDRGELYYTDDHYDSFQRIMER